MCIFGGGNPAPPPPALTAPPPPPPPATINTSAVIDVTGVHVYCVLDVVLEVTVRVPHEYVPSGVSA